MLEVSNEDQCLAKHIKNHIHYNLRNNNIVLPVIVASQMEIYKNFDQNSKLEMQLSGMNGLRNNGNWQYPINGNVDMVNRSQGHRHSPVNTDKLLQNSDDPLICRGADDVINDEDNQPEFKTLIAAVMHDNNIPQYNESTIKKSVSTVTKALKATTTTTTQIDQNSAGEQLMNGQMENDFDDFKSIALAKQRSMKAQKSRRLLKLQFQPQHGLGKCLKAIPQQAQQEYHFIPNKTIKNQLQQISNSKDVDMPLSISTNEKVRHFLKKNEAKLAKQNSKRLQEKIFKSGHEDTFNNRPLTAKEHSSAIVLAHNRARIPEVAETDSKPSHHSFPTVIEKPSNYVLPALAETINNLNLPYMGEITLNNSKPRRGRKPKKADICHLISKNYGTAAIPMKQQANKYELNEEPLNLCMRDHQAPCPRSLCGHNINGLSIQQHLKLYGRKTAMKEQEFKMNTSIKSEYPRDSHLSTSTSPPCPMHGPIIDEDKSKLQLNSINRCNQKLPNESAQKQMINKISIPLETVYENNQLSLKIPIPKGLRMPIEMEQLAAADSDSPFKSHTKPIPTITHYPAKYLQQVLPQKRKRCAIFIPPLPLENSTNPATEVSICKFKFTGGAKPMLQEKKMLSVDSDGNYCFYSGTGDKSSRGYEFFSRENFQQSRLQPDAIFNATQSNCPASEEKISPDIQPPSAGLSDEILQIPESSNASLLHPLNGDASSYLNRSTVSPFLIPMEERSPVFLNEVNDTKEKSIEYLRVKSAADLMQQTNCAPIDNEKAMKCSNEKKKSKQSVKREKLENAFKEKGFLIQTQKLESAEGATYCKFRQLKKFTRYIFRNWKDYLPSEMQQANATAAAVVAATAFAKNQ